MGEARSAKPTWKSPKGSLGAVVARLSCKQKAPCSIHGGSRIYIFLCKKEYKLIKKLYPL